MYRLNISHGLEYRSYMFSPDPSVPLPFCLGWNNLLSLISVPPFCPTYLSFCRSEAGNAILSRHLISPFRSASTTIYYLSDAIDNCFFSNSYMISKGPPYCATYCLNVTIAVEKSQVSVDAGAHLDVSYWARSYELLSAFPTERLDECTNNHTRMFEKHCC